MNKLTDQSHDRQYFIQIPQIVLMLCRTPQDLALWCVIKMIIGENGGECYLSTDDLATLSMMSTGKVSDSRKHLIASGLLEGEKRKDPGYPQEVWHLRIPDIWEENIRWRKMANSLKGRIVQKKQITKDYKLSGGFRTFTKVGQNMTVNSLHNMKPSQYEEGYSQNEEGYSQNEAKNNQQEKPKVRTRENPRKKIQKNGDYLDDILKPVSEVTGPNPDDQWWGHRDKFLKAFEDAMQRPPSQIEKQEIINLSKSADLATWKLALKESDMNWSGNGKVPTARIIEVCNAGGTWVKWKAKTYPEDEPTQSTQTLTSEQLEVYKKLEEL